MEGLSDLGLTSEHALDLKRLRFNLLRGGFVLGEQLGYKVFLDLDRLLLVFEFDLAIVDSEVRYVL